MLWVQLGSGHDATAQASAAALLAPLTVGRKVTTHESLFTFDPEQLGQHVSSLQLLLHIAALPAGWRLENLNAASGSVVSGSPLLTLRLEKSEPAHDRVDIFAPLSGIMVPLENVPDAVFAQRMVGDGISIDPVDYEVLAPVAGEITQLHAARHALTIRTPHGLELLLHVGIDTVRLKGDGFAAFVKEGDRVSVGQRLLSFEADRVACGAASLLTQVLVANVDRIKSLRPTLGRVQAGRDVAFTVILKEVEANVVTAAPLTTPVVSSAPITLPNPVGLHARPAATLSAAAKRYSGDIRLIRQAEGQRPTATANARSVVAIMGLETRQGDCVVVTANGTDAAAAVSALAELLASGCGEDLHAAQASHRAEPARVAVVVPPVAPAVSAPPPADGLLRGVSASPGLVIGTVFHLRREQLTVVERGGPPAEEEAAFAQAMTNARTVLATQAAADTDAARRQILHAHGELLEDPDLKDAVRAGILAGQSAAFAWQAAIDQQATILAGLTNPLLRERASDLRDVGRRVLALLVGVEDRARSVPLGSILIAEELTPSDTARFEPGAVLGFCTTTGGATSHVAILARSLGLPAVCGIDAPVLSLMEGTTVILDGTAATLAFAPSADALAEAAKKRAAWDARQLQNLAGAHLPAITLDGVHIEVAANVTSAAETQAGVAQGADGVGLLRSEFLFDHRDTAPSEDEQATAYIAVAQALGQERTLVVRTLDVGGDKPLSYLPLPKEENPFLGMRGLRVGLDRPEILRPQLRAILRAASFTRLHVMFPMVTSIDELRTARAMLEVERQALGGPAVQVGVMIEVPAAALLASHLAREADFFSIGTNDLTQYVLAMDRGHPRLAKQADALHPAVLTAIKMTCDGAHAHGRWVGVCGGLAGEELAVPALIGLGVDELSVPVPAIPAIKAAVARCDRQRCIALAAELLALSTPAEVRARLLTFAATPA